MGSAGQLFQKLGALPFNKLKVNNSAILARILSNRGNQVVVQVPGHSFHGAVVLQEDQLLILKNQAEMITRWVREHNTSYNGMIPVVGVERGFKKSCRIEK